ncbi:hypothetical protein MASR2M78_34620 [Treponema sp.]
MLRYEKLQKDALLVLTNWQTIDSLTNDVLMKRASMADGAYPDLVSEWERRTLEFSLSLARLNDEKRLRPLGKEVVLGVEGAVGVWVRAERKLAAARKEIRRMMLSEIGSKIMVNGFLPTFYQMRIEGLLSESEIIQVRDVLYSLDNLDSTTTQFDQRLRVVVDHVSLAADAQIRQAAYLSILMAFGFLVLAAFGLIYFRRFRSEVISRRTEKARLLRDYLADLFDPAAEDEAVAKAASALHELKEELPFAPHIALLLLRFDRGQKGSYPIDPLLSASEHVQGPPRLCFQLEPDIVVVLADAAQGTESLLRLASVLRTSFITEGKTISLALSLPLAGGMERQMLMQHVLEAFSYRYVRGTEATIMVEADPRREMEPFMYPAQADEYIGKRILEGKVEEAKRYIDTIIQKASQYSPAVARAVVARISATVFGTIEKLERAVGFSLPSVSIERLAEIANLDTLSGARDRFFIILDEIATILEKNRREHGSDLVAKTDSLIAEHLADPNLSLDLIAERLSLSTSHLGRTYRKIAGFSVAECINNKRLDQVRVLLSDTRQTVDAIAAATGIANTGNVYRLFKARFGLTPNEYREKKEAHERQGT